MPVLSTTHVGTGRPCIVLQPAPFPEAPPYTSGAGKYVLLLACAEFAATTAVEARRWIDSGAAYICAWGPYGNIFEETFDYAGFIPEVGEPLQYTLMTTSHSNEELEEALWFAFWCTSAPDDLDADLSLVVIQADSPELAAKATRWVQSNHE